jgi:FKBP-type peptidyl-prolyl cis-trans isomerase FkpA
MNRLLIVPALALGLALSLSACASTPAPAPQVALGTGTAEGWAAGNAEYLRLNGLRRGWTTTESGLQYCRVGPANPSGRQPTGADTVKVHYRGTFVDGRPFDSSYDRNEPAEFPLNRVIKGWTEGVALMREGEKFEFVIPASLGYGQRWVGGDELPPDSTLLFTVELLEVQPTP